MTTALCSPDVSTYVLENMKVYGAESIEVEFRLGKVGQSQFERVREMFRTSNVMAYLGKTTTREEFNGTDARRVYASKENTGTGGYVETPITMYKKRLKIHDAGGVRLGISLERRGDPNTERPYTMYRIKERDSFVFDRAWRIDFTLVETNDERYSDSDEKLYEIEVELLNTSDMLYYYTMDYLINMGYTIASDIAQALRS